VITGTVEEAVEQLRALHEAGCHRVMAQHHLHRDIEAIELIGREVAPLVAAFV
jgi:alkanesulfonate monooxygenase SsuD/methylene tetrahydromethanopterin reductase-like flavin-dependent oxidoreductase (luciferase family)